MKMRVLYFSGKKKIADIAERLSKNSDDYKADKIPPDYSLDKERLLVIGASLSNTLPDAFRRFCSSLTTERAKYVALYTDSTPEAAAKLLDLMRESNINVIDNVMYVKTGFLPFARATEEELNAADRWFEEISAVTK